MDSNRLQYLIDRYLANSASDAELNELTAWYEQIDYGSESFEEWVRDMGGRDNLTEYMYGAFSEKLSKQERNHKIGRIYRVLSVAAMLTLILGSWAFFRFKDRVDNQPMNNSTVVQIVPGKNTAILTLADGSKVTLDDKKNGNVAKQGGVIVVKTKTGGLVYAHNNKTTSEPESVLYNTVSTPRGGQYQIKLPDGTQVWLNAESSIKYPVSFSKLERRVELTGEAYFEVTHNDHQPFKVITRNQEIKVLGTHFDVNGYNDEPNISTTLLQGSVLVRNLTSKKSQLLHPGQQSVVLNNDEISVKTVNVQQVISWKNGYFLFDQMDIANIMRIMSRWYDVDIQYNDIDKSAVFGGTFSRNANIKDILNNLQMLGQVHFQIEGRKVIVSK